MLIKPDVDNDGNPHIINQTHIYRLSPSKNALLLDILVGIKNGITLEKKRIIMKSCVAFDDNSNIIQVQLTNMPILPEEEVLEGLKQSLAPFGRLMDVGVYKEKKLKLYTATGYAMIGANKEDIIKFQPLSHLTNRCCWIYPNIKWISDNRVNL
ncbi:unnamed protein product [Cunninghamella echinulata]